LEALRRRLAHLMVGRLVLCVAILGVALLVTSQDGGEEAARTGRGLYVTVVLAFAATITYAALLGRVRRVRAFGATQVATDLAVASALVHFTGGVESIFAFLYIPITVYAALLLGRQGAYGASALAALAYGVVALLPHLQLVGAERQGVQVDADGAVAVGEGQADLLPPAGALPVLVLLVDGVDGEPLFARDWHQLPDWPNPHRLPGGHGPGECPLREVGGERCVVGVAIGSSHDPDHCYEGDTRAQSKEQGGHQPGRPPLES